MKKKIILILIASMLFSLVACSGQDSPEISNEGIDDINEAQSIVNEDVVLDTVRIGWQQPLTGAQAGQGIGVKDACELALDIINNSYPDLDFPFAATEGLPNKGGQKLEFIWGDNKGSAQDAMTEAERLITEDVVMLCSANSSGLVAAASEVAERVGIPYINELGSSPSLNTRGYKWFFAIHPDDNDFADMFFSFADDLNKKGESIKTIALIYMNNSFGFDGAAAIKDRAEAAGYEISVELPYDNKTNNLSSEVQKLKAVDADVVMAFSYITDGALLIKTMKEMDYSPKMFYGQGGFPEREFCEILG